MEKQTFAGARRCELVYKSGMEATLSEDGKVELPQHIVETDHLPPGTPFNVTRLCAGHYLLALKKVPSAGRVEVVEGPDGHLVFNTFNASVLTSALVNELEASTP